MQNIKVWTICKTYKHKREWPGRSQRDASKPCCPLLLEGMPHSCAQRQHQRRCQTGWCPHLHRQRTRLPLQGCVCGVPLAKPAPWRGRSRPEFRTCWLVSAPRPHGPNKPGRFRVREGEVRPTARYVQSDVIRASFGEVTKLPMRHAPTEIATPGPVQARPCHALFEQNADNDSGVLDMTSLLLGVTEQVLRQRTQRARLGPMMASCQKQLRL